jgi:hypothetical protein
MRKSKTIQIISVIYILLNIVIPSVLIFSSLFHPDLEIKNESSSNTMKFIFLLVTLPVYIIYAGIIFKYLIHTSSLSVFFAFIPTVLTVVFIITGYKESYVFLSFVFDSLPLFLGISTLLIVGTVVLIIKKMTVDKDKLFIKIIVTLIIIGLLSVPIVYFFDVGIQLSRMLYIKNEDINIIKFLFSVCLVIFFHYKLIIDLYQKGLF